MAAENVFSGDNEYDKTVIQRGVVLRGDISTTGDVDLWGNLVGNMKANGDVRVGGKIRGDINADRIGVYAGAVQGDITGVREITLDEEAIVVGNLVCNDDITVYGKIKGNLTANGRATLQSAAQMIGDVTARLISLN
ncbi:MAG: polymer-forming cytoskeletal protein, partial [Hydrogenoanaerobacterium sp.]